jgi:predicted permease
MSFLIGFRHRLRVLLRGEAYAREIEREMRFHLDLEALAQTHAGAEAVSAELMAQRRFGNVTYQREEVRRMTLLHWLDIIRQDASYAWRGLRRSPGFTITVAATLGLGLGVNGAMFSFLDQLFLRPPTGVVAPGEVRRLYQDNARDDDPSGRMAFSDFTYPHVRGIRRATASVADLGIFTSTDPVKITRDSAIVPARMALASASYFSILGVRPAAGRFFAPDEDRVETPAPVAIISAALWRRGFAADSGVIGARVLIDKDPFTIIGIAPEGFTGIDLDATDVWVPINHDVWGSDDREPWYETFNSNFELIARLRSPAAERRLTDLATEAFRPVRIRGFSFDTLGFIRTGPILAAMGPGRLDKSLSISLRLAGVALIVLAIACANVSNLLLVRSTRRRRELAVRRALGVSGARLFGQLLTESTLLAAIGGIVAAAMALWAAGALRSLLLPDIHWAEGSLDVRTIVFVGATAVAAGLVAGLAPALQANRPDVINSLKAGSREGAYRRSRLRGALLLTQAALSVVLLVGAGLFVRSLANVKGIDLGYDVDRLLFIRASFPVESDRSVDVSTAVPQAAERLSTAPGVEGVAYASASPMGSSQ